MKWLHVCSCTTWPVGLGEITWLKSVGKQRFRNRQVAQLILCVITRLMVSALQWKSTQVLSCLALISEETYVSPVVAIQSNTAVTNIEPIS